MAEIYAGHRCRRRPRRVPHRGRALPTSAATRSTAPSGRMKGSLRADVVNPTRRRAARRSRRQSYRFRIRRSRVRVGGACRPDPFLSASQIADALYDVMDETELLILPVQQQLELSARCLTDFVTERWSLPHGNVTEARRGGSAPHLYQRGP